MAKGLTTGDSVRVVNRVQLPADIKSNLYYPHYAGLTGVIGKVYNDNTASVTVDVESLPPPIRTRHESSTQSMRQKWLDGLSDEARNRLTAAEKKLSLRYAVLVALDDLNPEVRSAAPISAPSKKIEAPAKASSASVASDATRKTLEEIEAEEAQHLAEIAKRRTEDPKLEF